MRLFLLLIFLFSCSAKKDIEYIDPWPNNKGVSKLKWLEYKQPEIIEHNSVDLSALQLSNTDLTGEWYKYDSLISGKGSKITFKNEDGKNKMVYESFFNFDHIEYRSERNYSLVNSNIILELPIKERGTESHCEELRFYSDLYIIQFENNICIISSCVVSYLNAQNKKGYKYLGSGLMASLFFKKGEKIIKPKS